MKLSILTFNIMTIKSKCFAGQQPDNVVITVLFPCLRRNRRSGGMQKKHGNGITTIPGSADSTIYLPTAINYTAMWDKTSFSPDAIDRELALAEGTGFNAVRVVLQFIVWEDDPHYFNDAIRNVSFYLL